MRWGGGEVRCGEVRGGDLWSNVGSGGEVEALGDQGRCSRCRGVRCGESSWGAMLCCTAR